MATSEYRSGCSERAKVNWPRAHETNRRNGNIRESKPEREFVAWLRTALGETDVEHHPKNVEGFDIDVLVRSTQTYIQFDGIYYHGLDRPYGELTEVIKRKYDRDRRADARFKELGLTLIRITDKQWAAMPDEATRTAWLAVSCKPTQLAA